MNAPTVAQVRRYLERHRWHPGGPTEDDTVWYGPSGWHTVIPNWPDDDTRLLDHSMVINVIAESLGRTIDGIADTVADILVDEDEFHGCLRECWPRNTSESEWAHTLKWGACAKATEEDAQPATLHIPQVWTAEDGYPVAGWTPVPLTLLAPWAARLSAQDQRTMLDAVADADPAAQPGIVARWQRYAEQIAQLLEGAEERRNEPAQSDDIEEIKRRIAEYNAAPASAPSNPTAETMKET